MRTFKVSVGGMGVELTEEPGLLVFGESEHLLEKPTDSSAGLLEASLCQRKLGEGTIDDGKLLGFWKALEGSEWALWLPVHLQKECEGRLGTPFSDSVPALLSYSLGHGTA